MAIPYTRLLPDVLTVVPGCPDMLAESNIRAAVIEFCEKSEAYRAEFDPINVVAKQHEYEVDTPIATTVHRLDWVKYDGFDLEPVSSSLLEQRLGDWRKDTGTPAYFVQQSSSALVIAPRPAKNVDAGLRIKAVLKPTHTSNACDDDLMNNYRDGILSGVLYRLLRMPNKDWTDLSAAGLYGSLFNESIARATEIARSANTGIARKVRYGGIGGSKGAWRTRRRDYGRSW